MYLITNDVRKERKRREGRNEEEIRGEEIWERKESGEGRKVEGTVERRKQEWVEESG